MWLHAHLQPMKSKWTAPWLAKVEINIDTITRKSQCLITDTIGSVCVCVSPAGVVTLSIQRAQRDFQLWTLLLAAMSAPSVSCKEAVIKSHKMVKAIHIYSNVSAHSLSFFLSHSLFTTPILSPFISAVFN